MNEKTTDAARIRALNDAFRTRGEGGGTILVTAGVAALGESAVVAILEGVRTFDLFSDANDPWREHDFGSFAHCEETIFFKIDYYDQARTAGSPDPADASLTHRVLTIMLASEY
jgi:hypothetical protein